MAKVRKMATIAVTPYITVRGEFESFTCIRGERGAVVRHQNKEVVGVLLGEPTIEGPLRPIR